MSELRAFCNQLIAFFEDLTETYPEEKDIATATQALRLLKQANPRMIYNVFMDNVYHEFSQRILDEDEEYILIRAKEILESKHTHMTYAFWIFDKHWSTMSETNKQAVWKYIKSLILLAGRV
jgi:adenylate cyclase class IV